MPRVARPVLAVVALLLALPARGRGAEEDDQLRQAVALARDRVYPALVNISVVTERLAGGRATRDLGAGSGVVVSPGGYVLTNYHVAENAIRIRCTLVSGEQIPADVVTHDPLTDLTVLKLRLHERADANLPLSFAAIGDSDRLRVGDRVLALGNPRGLGSSLTLGVVSNASRVFTSFTGSAIQDVNLDDGTPTGLFTRWIQHDALIQPGNSGGPLVDLAGEVVGINELGGGGIGFAIPSNLAKEVLNRALTFGRIDRGWLGVTVLPVRALDRQEGALVAAVLPGQPMARAGIRPGDLLLRVGRSEVAVARFEDVPGFYAEAARLAVGAEVEVVYLRDGERRTATVCVDPMEPYRGEERVFPAWGVSASAITGPMAFARGLPDTKGVLLTGIRPGKPGEVARPALAPGDVVVAVGADAVEGLDGFARLVAAAVDEKELLVRFHRGKRDMVTVLDLTRKPPKRRGSELPKAWLGVETQVLTPEVARALGLEGRKGFRVSRVLPGTRAEAAGLVPGDVVVAVDGDPLDASRLQDAELLRRRVEDMDVDATARLSVLRGGGDVEVAVVLEASPDGAAEPRTAEDEVLEYAVREIAYRDRVERDWALDAVGVVVASVESGGWASLAGLASGDLLLELHGRPVASIADFESATAAVVAERPSRVRMFVRRGRTTTFVFPEPEWPKAGS